MSGSPWVRWRQLRLWTLVWTCLCGILSQWCHLPTLLIGEPAFNPQRSLYSFIDQLFVLLDLLRLNRSLALRPLSCYLLADQVYSPHHLLKDVAPHSPISKHTYRYQNVLANNLLQFPRISSIWYLAVLKCLYLLQPTIGQESICILDHVPVLVTFLLGITLVAPFEFVEVSLPLPSAIVLLHLGHHLRSCLHLCLYFWDFLLSSPLVTF